MSSISQNISPKITEHRHLDTLKALDSTERYSPQAIAEAERSIQAIHQDLLVRSQRAKDARERKEQIKKETIEKKKQKRKEFLNKTMDTIKTGMTSSLSPNKRSAAPAYLGKKTLASHKIEINLMMHCAITNFAGETLRQRSN